jgi:hypothetical protein
VPTKAEHKAKAEHNEYLVSTLANPFFDWQVTAMFYAALQYIQAYFVAKGISPPPSTHNMRNNHVSKDKILTTIYVDYRALQDESRTARYGCGFPNQADVARLQAHLNTIKALVTPHIA